MEYQLLLQNGEFSFNKTVKNVASFADNDATYAFLDKEGNLLFIAPIKNVVYVERVED